MWRRAQEAYDLAKEANINAGLAVSEIRTHIKFCTDREEQRDEEHRQNLRGIKELSQSVNSLKSWVITFIFSVGGSLIIGLLMALAWMLVHFVIEPVGK